jgi:hypothetical protein
MKINNNKEKEGPHKSFCSYNKEEEGIHKWFYMYNNT